MSRAAPGPARSWSRCNGRLESRDGAEVESTVGVLKGAPVCVHSGRVGEAVEAAEDVVETEAFAGSLTSAYTEEEARYAGLARSTEESSVDEAPEEALEALVEALGLASLSAAGGATGADVAPLLTAEEDGAETLLTTATARCVGGLRGKQTQGTEFVFPDGTRHVLLPPGGLLPREAVDRYLTQGKCGGTSVHYTLACLSGGGLGEAFCDYPPLCAEALNMAKRLDSLSDGMCEVLWASLAAGWREQLPWIQARVGVPADDLWVTGPRGRLDYPWQDDETDRDHVCEMACSELELRERRHKTNLALASERAYLKMVDDLAQAAGTKNVRRARRAMGRRMPGPYQGVVPQAIAEHLVEVESGADADSVRAIGHGADLDGSGTHSTSPASSLAGFDSNGSDAALRSGLITIPYLACSLEHGHSLHTSAAHPSCSTQAQLSTTVLQPVPCSSSCGPWMTRQIEEEESEEEEWDGGPIQSEDDWSGGEDAEDDDY